MDEWKIMQALGLLMDEWKIMQHEFVDVWIKNHASIRFINGWTCLIVIP
jgi:hypothetical protein